MDKHDKISIKLFDGSQFSIWKYYMEIIFKAKVLPIVIRIDKQPIIDTMTASIDDQELLDIWDEKNDNACMFISKSIS